MTTEDSPEFVDPDVHHRYWGITGHLSYLVTMTRGDLTFAYPELSKFVQRPGAVHMKAAERVLSFLRGSYQDCLIYRDPGPQSRNVMSGWVDSNYASDPD
eukprot:1463973-Rhodomonas_salina.1